MKREKKIFVTFSACMVALGICLVFYFKPHRSVRKEEAAFKLSVSTLVDEFSTDESRANSLYLGKILEVQGRLNEIISNDSTLVLLLRDSTHDIGVSCYLQKDQKEVYTTLRPGDSVHVKGICNGMLLDVMLDKGILLSER